MLQNWNKICFISGYVEVSTTLLGPNTGTTGYVSRFWFHGFFFCVAVLCLSALVFFLVAWRVDFGRPGYGETTNGMCHYT